MHSSLFDDAGRQAVHLPLVDDRVFSIHTLRFPNTQHFLPRVGSCAPPPASIHTQTSNPLPPTLA